jgi:hypothetical protein
MVFPTNCFRGNTLAVLDTLVPNSQRESERLDQSMRANYLGTRLGEVGTRGAEDSFD